MEGGLPEWLRPPTGGALQRTGDLRPLWYQQWFTGDGDSRQCPSHPEASLLLFCECGTRLADNANFKSRRPLALGFAGPRSSGKTLLTIAMVEQLRGLEVAGRSMALEGLGDTEERFHRLASRPLREGLKPKTTDLEEASSDADRNFCWKLLVDGPGRRPVDEGFLAVYDVAGESWGAQRGQSFGRFDRYVGLLGSMVFLIDGAEVAADLGITEQDAWHDAEFSAGEGLWNDRQWLPRVLERLGKRAAQVDLALVLSKADYLWAHADWAALKAGSAEDSRSAVEKILRKTRRLDLLTVARRHFRHVELFAVSSLGFHPGSGDVDDALRLRRKIEPHGVAEPLKWLITQRLAGLR